MDDDQIDSTSDRASVTAPVLEPTDLGMPTGDRRPGLGVVATAAVAVVTLLLVGAWVATDADEPTLADGESLDADSSLDEEAVAVVESTLAIQGPLAMLVLFVPGPIDEAEDARGACSTQFDPFGAASYAEASILDPVAGSEQVLIVESLGSVSFCEHSSSTGFSTPPDGDAFHPVVIGAWGSRDTAMMYEGRVVDGVLDVVVLEPLLESQTFRQSDGWFRIEAPKPADSSVDELVFWEIEVRFEDGRTVRMTSNDSPSGLDETSRCWSNADCMTGQVRSLAEHALDAGASIQGMALADGVLDQAEYDAAVNRFRQCLALVSSLQREVPTAWVVEGTRAYVQATGCVESEIQFVEEARQWQNAHVSTLGPPALTEPDVVGDDTSSDIGEEVGPRTPATTMPPTISTTAPAPAALPLQSNIAAVNPAGINRAGGRGVGIVDGTGDVVAIDLETGEVVERLAGLATQATYYGTPQLNWDGTALYLARAVEDSWFSCESSPGAIVRVDLASGESEVIAAGTDPRISPDGTKLAYLAASQCIPDVYSSTPDDFVLTIYDSVVVRDLATGEERTWISEDLAAAIDAAGAGEEVGDLGEAQLRSLAWVSADVIAVGDLRLDVRSMDVIRTAAGGAIETGSVGESLGYNDEVTGFVVAVSPNPGHMVVSVGRENGTWERLSPATFTTVAFDASLDNLAWLDGRTLYVDGRTVELDVDLAGYDW